MIKLEHLNLVVKNMEETLAFYKAAFPEWTVRGGGADEWYGVAKNWLHFGDEYQYLTFNDNGHGENRDLKSYQVGLAHFAFVTTNLAAVTARLLEAGFPVYKPGAENSHRKNSYFLDPNGYELEFVEYLSDLPSQRNQYDES